ncbi:hypothetical protein D9757_007401 [Collybiopsis confluens]|uniref:Peroxidase n=1 Tax=Collybiopsis confluens TaxID=2823264 RepID=A0A8H5M7P3_9AGAR|nr:hypothetical protein D9757_007401 [Collybiopsis confluens]
MSVFFRAALITALVASSFAQTFSTFTWPNAQLNYADKQLYEGGLSVVAQGCPSRDNSTIPAQWLRIAYHDMSTHNVDDGTGGLDASIQYELDRPQNIGTGMAQSMNDFGVLFTLTAPFFGNMLADVIALGAILAVKACGGPLIPFRAGRVDATSAGPETVPEPQQDLAVHTESFRKQGFSPTEMISLVACGHTLGGVRRADFPLVVTDPNADVVTFDSTTAFDNAVVSEYLRNTTENVLVVGPNVTTRSDFRIFSSDGNTTMQSMLSPDAFNQTCGDLIERMINTVPNGVELSDPIAEPFNYIVSEPLLSYQNGMLSLSTTLRVLNSNPSRTVTMFWADRNTEAASFCPPSGCSVNSSSSSNSITLSLIGKAQGVTADRYSFNLSTPAISSISKFWFQIDENGGSSPLITVDNGGSGFVIGQDAVFIDNSRSTQEFVFVPSFKIVNRLVVAVRGDSSSTVSVTTFDASFSSSTPPFKPTISTVQLELDNQNPAQGEFTFFTANITSTVTFLNLTANINGTTYMQENFDMTVTRFSD